MKWILLVMICWGAECQTMYEEFIYDNQEDCLTQAAIVSDYAQMTYPNSTGKVYCLTQSEFDAWLQKGTAQPSSAIQLTLPKIPNIISA